MTASKMFNRLLSVLLLVCMLVSFAPAAFAEEPADVEDPVNVEEPVDVEEPANVEEPAAAEPAELPAAESAAFAVATAALLPGGNLGGIKDQVPSIEPMAPGGSVKCNFYSNPPAEAGVTEVSLLNQTVTLGNLSLFAGKFAIDGYKQTGWNTARDGKGQAYALNGTITVASTLYAQWEPDEQEPTYELKPAQPSESLVGTAYVRVYTNDGAHSFDSLSNALVKYAGNVVIGEVEGNDNVGYSCQITVYLESGDELESRISSALDGKYPDEYPEGDWIYDFAKTNNPITFTIYNLSGTNKWWGSKEAVTNASSTDLKSSCASQIAIYMAPPAVYTVTYTDGVEDEEIFADQVYTVKDGDKTPAFVGTPTRTNYTFTGWDPKVAETVSADVTYTAQWEPTTKNMPAKTKWLTDTSVKAMCIRAYAIEPLNPANEMPSISVKVSTYGLTNASWTIGDVEGNDVDGYTQTVTFHFASGDALESYARNSFNTNKNLNFPDEWQGDWVYNFDYFEADQSITFTWNTTSKKWTIPGASNITTAVGIYIKTYLELPKYTVTFTDGVENAEVFEDQVYTVPNGRATPEYTPVREGYTFAGWDPKVAETVTEDATYTAVWTANTYTVSFAPNGGSAIDPVTVVYDSQYGFYNGNTMRKNLPSADMIDGLQNKGWYIINEDGTLGETSIQKTTYVKTARDHTLFQQREIKVPTVTVTPASISAYYNGEQRTLSASTKEYEGLVYSYQWYKNGELIEGATDKDLVLDGNVADSGTYKVVVTVTKGAELAEVITVNESAVGEKEVTVTIRKIANTIQYDANGGEGGPVNNFSNATYATVQLGQPTREGYTFTGWNTEADGSGDSYKGGDVYTFEGDVGNGGQKVILYAQWSANEYLLHVNPANGEDVYDVTITYEDVVGDKVAEPVWAGHTFTGWVDQDGESVDQEALYTEALESIIATWKLNEYVVPVDPANGEDVTDVTYTYEDVIGDKYDFSKDPTRKGYTFEGWVDQDGNPVDLKATYTEDIQSINGSWKGKTYTVTFKLEEDEGTLSFTEKKVVNGDPLGYTPKVEREGYTFIGWYDENGKYYNSETIFDAARDITLTGRWTKTVVPTGDDSDPALFALMMLGSLACAGAILIRLRKREDQV